MQGVKRIAVWVLTILLAALFAIQGAIKLSGSPAWESRFRSWGYPEHFYLAVGALEVLGGLALLVPRLTRFSAGLLIVIMVAATATHVVHQERQAVTTVVLLSLLSIVFYMRRVEAAKIMK